MEVIWFNVTPSGMLHRVASIIRVMSKWLGKAGLDVGGGRTGHKVGLTIG
jgi:hypothetical protein